jgi:hypothetical protein
MYPEGELARLAADKAVLRARIAVRRAQCVARAQAALRPVIWLDDARDLWERMSPFAKLLLPPLGGLADAASRARWPATLLRWAPLVIAAVRALGQFRSKPAP